MKLFKKADIVLLLSIFIACNYYIDVDPPEVIDIIPYNRSVVIDQHPAIEIKFSETMDKAKTEEAFTITGEHQPKGHFRWDGNSIYFDLIEDLHNATVYTITIRSSAEDKSGNNLTNNVTSTFSIGSDLIKPEIIQILPSDGTFVEDLFTPILVSFSEPVQLDSVKKGFSTSPYIVGNITLENNNATLVFTPYDPYIHGVLYSVILSTDITDVAGNRLLKEYKSLFKAGTDFNNPSLNPESTNPPDYSIGVFSEYNNSLLRLIPFTNNEGADKNSKVHLVFSKSMQRIDTQKSISISPFIDFTFTWLNDREIQINPATSFILQQTYTINISTQAKDIAGNVLDQDYSYPFTINGSMSLPLEVEPYNNLNKHIYQMAWEEDGSGPAEIYRTLENDDIIFDDSNYTKLKLINSNLESVWILRIPFNNSANTLDTIGGIDLNSGMQSITFNTILSHNQIQAPQIWKIIIPNGHKNYIDIYLFDLEPQCYYKLSVTHGQDGIKDICNNYMVNPFLIYLNH